MGRAQCALLILLSLTSAAHGVGPWGRSDVTSTSPQEPAPTPFESAMFHTFRAVKEGRVPDPSLRRADGTYGTLLEALQPAFASSEVTEHHRRKLAAGGNSWRFFGANIQFLEGPPLSALNQSLHRYASITPNATVDWRRTMHITPIQVQYDCAVCWAMAAVDAVAMAYAITTRSPAVAASVQQMCDTPNATFPSCGNETCCQGGWPEDAFSWLVSAGNVTSNANYNYWAQDGRTCTLGSNYPIAGAITGWERVPLMSMRELQRAVNAQPVLVYISASSPDFRNYTSTAPGTAGFRIYDGNCTTEVNHALLAVGYNTTGPISYWILKNTWPTTLGNTTGWGDNGYMYIRMTDGVGKCGMQTVNPLYPVYFPNSPTLATVSGSTVTSTGTVISPNTTNVGSCASFNYSNATCGSGTCWMQANGVARCNCLQGFVENQGVPTSKCVPWSVCLTPLFNPCGVGSCLSVGDGSYVCGCPAGYTVGSRVNGAPTCVPVPASSFKSFQYSAQAGDTCAKLQIAYGMTASMFLSLNRYLRCTAGNSGNQKALAAGVVVNLISSSTPVCSQQYAVRLGDTCSSIAQVIDTNPTMFSTRLAATYYTTSTNPDLQPTLLSSVTAVPADNGRNYPSTSLLALNPALNCSSLMYLQPVCVQGPTTTSAAAPIQCGSSYTTANGDSCATISTKYGLSPAYLLQLNPGLNCNFNGGSFLDGIQICIGPATASVTQVNCTTWYSVQQGDSCAQIWNAASLSQFQLLYINPGLQCQPPFLYVGLQICIDAPILNSIADPNYLSYTVQPNDTWSVIQSQFTSRCQQGSITTKKLVFANSVCSNGTLNRNTTANSTFPYRYNCTSNGTFIGNWTQFNPIRGTTLVIPCAPKIGASCGCVDSLVSCGCDLVNYPSYCDARCNFATPLASSSACSACQTACQGIYGQPPDPPNVCPPNYVCPMPVWAPPASDASAVFSSRPLCNYRNKTCTNVCTIYATVNGSPTAVDADCYNLCYACHKAPCVGPSIIVDVGTSPCSTCSVAGCTSAGSGACQIQCSYWNSLYTALNV